MLAGPRVKGLAFETVLGEVRRLRGPETAHAVMELLTARGNEVVGTSVIMVNGWYSIAAYRGLLAAIRDATGEGTEVIRLIGNSSVHTDIPRLYQRLLHALTPKTITQLGARYFKRIYDTGTLSVVSEEDRRIEARFANCDGFDRNMWVEVSGSIEAFVELAGVSEVTVRITDGGRDDDPTATMIARWG